MHYACFTPSVKFLNVMRDNESSWTCEPWYTPHTDCITRTHDMHPYRETRPRSLTDAHMTWTCRSRHVHTWHEPVQGDTYTLLHWRSYDMNLYSETRAHSLTNTHAHAHSLTNTHMTLTYSDPHQHAHSNPHAHDMNERTPSPTRTLPPTRTWYELSYSHPHQHSHSHPHAHARVYTRWARSTQSVMRKAARIWV